MLACLRACVRACACVCVISRVLTESRHQRYVRPLHQEQHVDPSERRDRHQHHDDRATSRLLLCVTNQKQCSRQLQCEVPCSIGNVVNSSSFLNSSILVLLVFHQSCCLLGGGVQVGEGVSGRGRGVWGRGQGTFHPPCHTLHCHMVLRPKGTSHNQRNAVDAAHLPSRVPNSINTLGTNLSCFGPLTMALA